MRSRTRSLLLAAGLCGLLGTALGLPSLHSASAAPAGATAGGEPPSAVEEFDYPDAAKILAEKKIKLLKGDGHLLFADCGNSPQQVKVWTRDGDFCFLANAQHGYVTLEVPKVWALETASHPISADVTARGKTETVNVSKTGPQDGYQSVGEGTEGTPAVLVELRVTG
ncbi:hypothetical protein RM550_32740 [Streptomyces sp. DSM 41527]|uniref:Secreted protein n=1 Tax=Streptomyces mooreae TaxID=3075523 RepID=A0ABU2THS0_9ACTN|nr:hypothetical protein [Streptomyces sp. DSM 41527]MDT0460435.1 hypothetical protein [Streptomyces sp. DSM 41527]